ncbi:hypothetical protein N7528_003917 [Penicillium herquei]|nr:hypothetical protein N7528_003917 [Penicillium herquei]
MSVLITTSSCYRGPEPGFSYTKHTNTEQIAYAESTFVAHKKNKKRSTDYRVPFFCECDPPITTRR